MRGRATRAARRAIAALSASTLVAVGAAVVLAAAPPARADTAPPNPGTPETVSADALPTVQINGVVWAQVTVGNTVYATGSFTSARPAGSPAGSNETARANLLAYDITTGNLITSFNHTLNAQGRAITASPDGTRVYVVGDFTTVDGQTHNRVAAFNTADGSLVNSFTGGTAASARAVTATNSTVYVGGIFASAMGNSRARLAAYSATNGALLNWAPTADDNQVTALVLTPDKSLVIVGGQFSTLNGVPAKGLGAIDATTGATVPWAANQLLQNSGNDAGFNSLYTDGTNIYGTGWVFGPGGNLEGVFAASPNTGNLVWVEDCHGDSYGTFALGDSVYTVSHEHFCGNIGAWPQTDPWTFHRATAFTKAATGTVQHNSVGGYYDFFGNPSPTQLDWYPTLPAGTYTGQSQAAWSITGNGSYISLGGEFPSVNGTAQQGLVRFAVKNLAPNHVGPQYSTSLQPNVVSLAAGTARVAWTPTWDPDNEALTYKVVRDGNTANPVYTTTVNSTFWQLKPTGFVDTGLAPGSSHTYKVYVYDPYNNTTNGPTSAAVTISSATAGQYVQDVQGDGASDYWRLGEPSGTAVYDWAGFSDLTAGSTVTRGAAGAIGGDANTASTFDGSATGTAAQSTTQPGPNTFTAEAWVKTTSTSGGKVIGFGDRNTGTSSSYDRHVYMDNAGHFIFGVYPNAVRTVSSPGTYNDGQWHHVVATLSSGGMVLYVDGKRVGRDTGTTSGQPYAGYWRIGGDNLGSWPSRPSSDFLNGSIDDVAVYPTALTSTQVQKHYVDAGYTLNIPQAPADAYGASIYGAGPDLYWRLDDASGPTAADASPNGSAGTYSGGVTYNVPSTVTGASGKGVTLNGSNGLIVSNTPVTNPTVYSEELWFKTATTSGGKLIGFGDAVSGNSSNYDRHVWMLNSGQLEFGVWTGQTNTITSPTSYNNGQWHHLVATQSGAGMKLYVDGTLVGTNPQTQAQGYTGRWRVGGDNTWGGASSNYFAGTVDEVAVYSAELTANQVAAHYSLGSGVNTAPTAAFTQTCTGLACTFDGSGSSDPDGTVASYAWDFGDGTTGTGSTPSHTYAAAGDYTVALTVTDNLGATGTVTQVVAPRPPANPSPSPFALDAFNRTVTGNSVGTADTGGAWTNYFGAGPRTVSAGVASFATATTGSQTGAYLGGVSKTDSDTTVTVTTDKVGTGNGVYIYTVGRRTASNNEYRGRIRLTSSNTVAVAITGLLNSSTEATLATEVSLAGVTYTPGLQLKVRLQVVGTSPTTLRLKVWPASVAEPGTWTRTATDSTATLQAAGSVGLSSFLSGSATNAPVVTQFSAFASAPTAGAPTASFTTSCTALACSADASASTDPNNAISSYTWSWADGTVTTGVTSNHTFAAAGTYRITLTVTNTFGWTDVTTRTVTVP